MRRNVKPKPTDEEIMTYDNVPTEIAARYIGWSNQAIRAALQVRSANYGHASQPGGTDWSYHINPVLLVKYKHGELPAYQLGDMLKLITDAVEVIFNAKMEGLNKIMKAIVGAGA